MYIREVMIVKKERAQCVRKKGHEKEVEQQQKMYLKQTSENITNHHQFTCSLLHIFDDVLLFDYDSKWGSY